MGSNSIGSLLLAMVFSGIALFALLQMISAVNSCDFDRSLPFPWVEACR